MDTGKTGPLSQLFHAGALFPLSNPALESHHRVTTHDIASSVKIHIIRRTGKTLLGIIIFLLSSARFPVARHCWPLELIAHLNTYYPSIPPYPTRRSKHKKGKSKKERKKSPHAFRMYPL